MANSQIPTVRTRFAPSPTGFLHVGGVRTALFAWLIARQKGGQFVLRLEDTDKAREIEGSEQHLIESLQSLGINYDEGPDNGGQFAPYRQSERLDIYKSWAQKLLDRGRAYPDPYTAQELQAFREQAQKEGKPFLYRNHRPNLVTEANHWDGKAPLRFKSSPGDYTWNDAVMGELHAGQESVDDFILIKADGYPTYNFAHIVDDAEMQITHVIRGQEFIASVPNYLNLYEALEITPPILATLPYVMAIDGHKKLSKRDGAKDVLDYLRDGFLPEALINFIATLGWNDGTEQEVFTVDELIEKFSLDRVQKSPARFDEQRLLWINGQHTRRLPLDELYERVKSFFPENSSEADEQYKKQVLGLVQDRLKTLADLPIMTSYFFGDPQPNWQMISDNKQLSKVDVDKLTNLLEQAKSKLEQSNFDPDSLQNTLNQLLVDTSQKPAVLFSIIRIGVSWAPFSPSLNNTLATLGKDTVLRRLQTAIDTAPK